MTIDDQGNIIPLGLRHNRSINDIRYGLIPLIPLTFGNKQVNKAKKGIKLIPKKQLGGLQRLIRKKVNIV